ncbi:MAG: group I intron-associated PD-(D/E)XK endonuclease [Candidatus Sulfotelmatobacter sp.]
MSGPNLGAGQMKRLQKFRTFKERGEWIELEFMAAAASRGYHVLKPWGDSLAYDVAIDHGGSLTRVQVKSGAVRNGGGYICRFLRGHKEPYTLEEVDVFAAYVVPVATWYLIPAAVILRPSPKSGLTLYPFSALKKDRCGYEHYREAWGLLGKSRSDLSLHNQRR